MSGPPCPRCGRAVPAGTLPRYGGACPDCLLAFAGEPDVPSIPGFRLGPLLGAGGMSEVYQATQEALGREVALKFLSDRLAGRPDALERFSREAATLARIDHPNVVRIHDYGVAEGVPYLVMERVHGESLRESLARERPTTARALEIAVQVAEALDAVHAVGVVHRDLKPENLLVEPSGRVRLVDFGLAKVAGEGPAQLTQSGVHVGTPGYMAPEQIANPRAIDARADLYALGLVLHEMLSGELPIGRLRPLEGDPGLLALVGRLLEKDPGDRPATAAEVARALRRAALPSRRIGRRAGLLAGALLAVAAGIWISRSGAKADWVEFAGSGSGIARGLMPSVAVDGRGRPVVASMYVSAGKVECHCRRWDGEAWVQVGPPLRVAGDAEVVRPALALDAQGRPMLAWHEGGGGATKVMFTRWSGSAWEESRELSRPQGGALHPALVADAAGNPTAAWFEGVPNRGMVLCLKRWEGGDWKDLGGNVEVAAPRMVGMLQPPPLALDPGGRPVIAWPEGVDASYRIRVAGWDGRGWSEFGEGIVQALRPTLQHGVLPALGVDGEGRPVAAWTDDSAGSRQVYVRRWSGRAWEELGGSASGKGISGHANASLPALAVDPSGRPVVAWQENLPSPKVRLRRWNGRDWEGLGDSASVAGVNRTPSAATRPALALGPDGQPVVAWQGADGEGGNWNVCCRAWRPGQGLATR